MACNSGGSWNLSGSRVKCRVEVGDGNIYMQHHPVPVPRDGLAHTKKMNRASLPKCEYDRGRKIDMADLVGRDSRYKQAEKEAGA